MKESSKSMKYNIIVVYLYRSKLTLDLNVDERKAYLLPNSTSFLVPNGTYRLRVLAVGGGGGGCGGIKQGRGRSGKPAVNIIHVSGPKAMNVSIGRGGQGEKGHSVESISNGLSSLFGDYVIALGGRGCTRESLVSLLRDVKGMRRLMLSKITTGDISIQLSYISMPVGGYGVLFSLIDLCFKEGNTKDILNMPFIEGITFNQNPLMLSWLIDFFFSIDSNTLSKRSFKCGQLSD